jgi:hypothetical protein
MTLPATLKICGKPFRVVRCKETLLEVDAFGKVDVNKLQVVILDDLPPPLEKDTVLHEIIHAIDEQLALKLKERQIEALGCMLQQVFADNPALMVYLAK